MQNSRVYFYYTNSRIKYFIQIQLPPESIVVITKPPAERAAPAPAPPVPRETPNIPNIINPVAKDLDRIKLRGMAASQPLHGSLAQCNKLKNNKMGLRVIFREVHGKVEVIQIVVIGKRDKKTVYKIAENRLN